MNRLRQMAIYTGAKCLLVLENFISTSRKDSYSAALQAGINSINANILSKKMAKCFSMKPVLSSEGSKSLVIYKNKALLSHWKMQKGIPVIFEHPIGSESFYVRRILAGPGDVLESRFGEADVDSFELEEDEYWLECDDRSTHYDVAVDSRTLGPVPLASIKGRALYYVNDKTNHGPFVNFLATYDSDISLLESEIDLNNILENAENRQS